VTFEVRPGILPRPRHPRLTTTFDNEAEAKSFARAKLGEGLIVFAGTINPFTPRRTVLPQDVAAWTADGKERVADEGNVVVTSTFHRATAWRNQIATLTKVSGLCRLPGRRTWNDE
jgi:hypothetical protein